MGNSAYKFFASHLYNKLIMGDFQIAFSNRILKRISNRTLNKSIKVRLKFRIHKLLISFYIVNQHIYLIFDFRKMIKSSTTN